MPLPRITMKDVARRLGVHITTVSLALRNSVKLPLATRVKVQDAAREMGYRQDPMLSALMAYRSGVAPHRVETTIAMIYDFRNPAELERAPGSYRNFHAGVATKAEELGFRVRRIFFDGPNRANEGRRISRMLLASGIRGVILCAFRPRTTSFELEWDRFSVVQIECQHLELPLPTVSTDQLAMAREAVRRLWKQGYRRIGFAVGREEDIYLDHAFTVGFFGEAGLHPELKPAPPLLLTNEQTIEDYGRDVRRWIRRHRLEAVITNWTTIVDVLRSTAKSGTPVPAVVELAIESEQGPFSGMAQRDTLVGERAMEQLSLLLKYNQTGRIAAPNRILIPGFWLDRALATGR